MAAGITALDGGDCPGVRDLLLARAAEGSGHCDEARLLIGSCLRAAPRLIPAIRDAMEYELCAGNWARALELASALARHRPPGGSFDICLIGIDVHRERTDIALHVGLWLIDRHRPALPWIHDAGGTDLTLDDLDLVAELLLAACARG